MRSPPISRAEGKRFVVRHLLPPHPPIVFDDMGGNFTPLFGELLDWLLYFARLTREVFIGWDIPISNCPDKHFRRREDLRICSRGSGQVLLIRFCPACSPISYELP
ncbi:hypothetical protein MCP1_40194 [Candidatus Terasakiella magnetica]|nr:hypothetical protein MCP1_40194 [Candidatus Terasakiella magnetica]